ncbi:Eco57I restriction-modification methylase domain-containing protein [Mucilaginibacter sp.]
MKKIDDVFSRLGLNRENGLFLTKENHWIKETSFPNRVKRLIEKKIEPDAFFSFDNKPMILFFDNPKNKNHLHEAIWNFNECPIAIILEDSSVEIYNGFSINEDSKLLKFLGGEEKLNDFSYFELVTGKTWEKNQKDFVYSNRVDYKLLKNIEAAQNELTQNLQVKREVANALLGKSIFIRYLIDREVKLNFEGESRSWKNIEFCELLNAPSKTKEFFDYLQDKNKGFDGDLFPITDSDFNKLPVEAFKLLQRLLSSEEIATGQQSLFQIYDFSILPIEFISNVYEKFIGKDNQADSGAFYTPTFLVDYILAKTVDEKTNSSSTDYTCRVLDPACGSGIFLVETLRKIIDKYKEVTEISLDSDDFKKALKQLAIENIYGIDEDASAIQVAIFSIYLTMLDYLEPAEIENFQFPNLINSNFFQADFFDESNIFNETLKNVAFDYIIGNPPWMRGKGEKVKPPFVQYIDKRRKNENVHDAPVCIIGNREIAQAFLIRSSDFCKGKTNCALIVTSKVLYNLQSISFRKYFLHNYKINRIFELAPVRREVFDKSNKKAITPACVLFFNYSKDKSTDSNVIEHIALKPSRFFSLFKIFTVSRADYKYVQQSKLKEYDWLWKVLVYGSYLDFNFLLRLKNEYESINDFLLESKALVKQGIKRKDGNKKIDVSELLGWDFLDLNKKEIKQFFISPEHQKWDIKEVGYVFRENNHICQDVFTPPVLLIKETVNTKLESVSAISTRKILFTDKITSIKYRNSNQIDNYYLLSGLMNSTFFAYYVLNITSTAGIMIEQQVNDEEKFGFPYIASQKLISVVKEIEQLKKDVFSEVLINEEKINEIEKKQDDLNKLITKTFDLSEEEKTLISYAQDIMIPLAMRSQGYEQLFHSLKYKDNILGAYAELFINRFKSNLSGNGKNFIAEIWHTSQVVGIFFKVIPEREYTEDVIWKNKQDDISGILPFLLKISSSKITDRLFVQKDVRGFYEDYFFIFKPNEKKLWHKAIGYLDVSEFADAILKAGRKGE